MKTSTDKIGIFGGTFNPVHNGHIRLLNSLARECRFDRIIVIPTALPPHKQVSHLASGEQRMKMCSLAFEDFRGIEISDYEIKKGGKSYTFETLAHFKTVYPNSALYFIMGTDMFLSFGEWREPQKILENAILLCGARDNSVSFEEIDYYAHKKLGLNEKQYKICFAEPFEISSSELRAKLVAGEDISMYVPKKVLQYIYSEKLYVK